ncbi:FAD-dependent oxidoreductase [Pediococcus acidilactici]|uniref:FAD-dependent oxidoreductase n=1 Tax=Pediococcus acidilactici TaxID=1254 RepID=UPI002935825F|nr:FAD-dependent oxidoreductase [Pediococcus acidilactici]MDV2603463.1 FAD-dependent oxidoreductase [Pediococcus acidilactici]MDV2844979.1 FAD-dependent oxidoreductase [Pediococcus acidilactici]WQS22391.1 FAD-dependent oxidoreductase [Pediococcus acidilactici]WQS27700.1 FAD-dependent oxidoreductase [Pediococcus acidilactici]
MKIAIVGCTHAGTFAAQQILTEHPDYDVTVYERNDNLSFLSCGIALWVGNHVSDPKKMFYSSPEALTELGATMKMKHDVLDIDPDTKTLKVKNLVTNEEFADTYDKLVMTTGSSPVIPPIDGIDNERIKLCKNWNDAAELKRIDDDVKSVVVIGAGYIGAELAEQYAITGREVTLIDGLPNVLAKNFDPEISDRVAKDYTDHGVKLAMNEMVQGFSGTDQITVKTDKGSYTADYAILCVGFRPHTSLLKNKVDMLKNGAIITDEYMQTSNPDIFAAGDASVVHYNPTGKDDYIPLATNAVRQGILIGHNIEKPTVKYLGTQASSAVALFGKTLASTGLTEGGAQARGVEVDSVTLEQDYRPEFMLTTTPILMRLVWDPKTRVVLGGAFYSDYDCAQSANTVSLAIQNKMTIDDLSMVDMFFQPNYDQPLNYINALAMAAVAKADSKK